MIKHSASARSPLHKKPSRSDIAWWQKVASFLRQTMTALLLLLVLGFVIFTVFLILAVRNQDSELVLFKSADKSEPIGKNTLAFFQNDTGQLYLYQLEFDLSLPEEAELAAAGFEGSVEQDQVRRLLQVFQLQVLLSDWLELEAGGIGDRQQLKSSLWQELTSAPVWSRQFWLAFSWWWRLERLASSQVTQEAFSDLESWQNYALAKDVRVSSQACSLAVVNQTNTDGLASNLGQALVRSGLFVARLTSERTSSPATTRLISDTNGDCFEAAGWLSQLSPDVELEIETNPELAARYRASLVILLGEDWANLVELLEEEPVPEGTNEQ